MASRSRIPGRWNPPRVCLGRGTDIPLPPIVAEPSLSAPAPFQRANGPVSLGYAPQPWPAEGERLSRAPVWICVRPLGLSTRSMRYTTPRARSASTFEPAGHTTPAATCGFKTAAHAAAFRGPRECVRRDLVEPASRPTASIDSTRQPHTKKRLPIPDSGGM
jgi:hypothetical protein